MKRNYSKTFNADESSEDLSPFSDTSQDSASSIDYFDIKKFEKVNPGFKAEKIKTIIVLTEIK